MGSMFAQSTVIASSAFARMKAKLERDMLENVERGGCRFILKTNGGETRIEMELFHATVPALADAILSFEMLGGITPEQAKSLADTMNDRIIGVVVARK